MNIVTEAVKLTNESNQKGVVSQAQRFIALIGGEQGSIRSCEARIKDLQNQLQGIAENSITISSVMGDSELPSDGNPNTATIIKAIEEANRANQDAVKITSTNLVGSITNEQNSIAACNKRIDGYREELSKLAAASVTVSGVMGS
jgi:gas vesicle protein